MGLAELYLTDPRFRAHYDDRSAGLAEYVAELGILARCQRVEHFPHVVELVLHVAHAGQVLYGLPQLIGTQEPDGAADLVDDQLDPEFGHLVLDDEQHFIMMRWVA